ncbi:MAG: hypothetical protein HY698_05485 [Deltaproteobacteria bacterium]|nr:hypothetical protein [Deltaproteobacteria bacterium]
MPCWFALLTVAGFALASLAAQARPAHADDADAAAAAPNGSAQLAAPTPGETSHPARASLGQILSGPFRSSHLFAMPTTDVVGAYVLSVAADGSLLSETGVLSGTGVAAVGFGDIAQLEYRLSTAVSTFARAPIALPSLGVQMKVPLPERKYLPALAVALRLGLTHEDEIAVGRRVRERVNDLYVVGRLHLWGPLAKVTLHGGLRVGRATIDDTGRTLLLPAGGWEVQMTPTTKLAGELALMPMFAPSATSTAHSIASKPFGRLGIRWSLHPALIIDASLGYRIEAARFDTSPQGGLGALIDWDIRLGAEVFLPWGVLVCRAGDWFFCKERRL